MAPVLLMRLPVRLDEPQEFEYHPQRYGGGKFSDRKHVNISDTHK